jgi:membrane protease YdiL (CAAX protease family)
MTDQRIPDWRPTRLDGTGASVAAGGIALWILLEFAFRRGLTPLLADPFGTALGADMTSVAIVFPLLAVVLYQWGRYAGIDRTESIGSLSRTTIGAGIVGAVGYVLLYGVTVSVASVLFELDSTATQAMADGGGVPAWAAGLLIVVNGVLVPITEEIAWRGVIQTALTDAYGSIIAIVLTATAFVLKHLIVDLAVMPLRMASLVVLAVILCGLRARYGTASSIVTHVTVNSLTTIPLALSLL